MTAITGLPWPAIVIYRTRFPNYPHCDRSSTPVAIQAPSACVPQLMVFRSRISVYVMGLTMTEASLPSQCLSSHGV